MAEPIYVGDKYLMNQQAYGYEWMNATQQAADLLDQIFPVLKEYGEAFGLLPSPPQTTPPPPPPPKPWYQDLPPWAIPAGVAVGVILLVKILEG